MMKATFITLGLLGLSAATPAPSASAKGDVVSLFIPMNSENWQFFGSVVGVDSTATTYVVDCIDLDSEDWDTCGDIPITLTQGPKTWASAAVLPSMTHTVNCILDGTTSATCTAIAIRTVPASEALTAENTNPAALVTETMSTANTFSKEDLTFVPVTITTTATGTAKTSTTTGGTATTAGPEATETSDSADDDVDDAEANASGTISSTGGMPKITGGAGLAMGGAAMAIVLAAL
ncbi:hypothetical protein AJ80_07288 [Polytolypa hystricis UAMH7299]|uniref:GPI anchored protein n=1 Tax=Polytolypa hystricis (strain UAMH7299) TaxID=1447883 RepID=A0A2B7XQU1_POLH7|nr:hypothetical protein AJ80_07288 [Polytolypa hystricis UAMH7299]